MVIKHRSAAIRSLITNDRGAYTITARITDPPDQREDAVYLDLDVIEIEDPRASDPLDAIRAVKGKVRVRMLASADYRIGDVLRFSGAPLTPSEDERFHTKITWLASGLKRFCIIPARYRLLTISNQICFAPNWNP